MIRKLTIFCSVLLCSVLFVSMAQAQYFGGYGGGGGYGYGGGYGGYGGYGGGVGSYLNNSGRNHYSNQRSYNDPRLGYCLENDCLGGQGGYGQGGYGQGGYGQGGYGNGNCGGCQQVARSRFVVERGGRRVMTYIGTYEGFVQRYPQYANKIARPVATPAPYSQSANSYGSPTPARETQPGYDTFGNPLPREMPPAQGQSSKPRNGNGSKAKVNKPTPAAGELELDSDDSPSDDLDDLDG